MCAAPESDGRTLLGLRLLPERRRVLAGYTAGELRAEVARRAAALNTSPGEPVALRRENDDEWVLALLTLLAAGARPLLLADGTPDKEMQRLLAEAGGTRWLAPNGTTLLGEPAPAGSAEPGVFLATSGSTGAPKLVFRSEGSLLAEGVRYQRALGLDGDDRLLLPLPLSHAYALGWLAAALVTGTEVRPCPPTALNTIASELAEGATIVALVPTLARLLAVRQSRRRGPAPALRLAMVGAGAVDEALEAGVRRAFGIATARNYGSTETGALFAGVPELPPLCVGEAMPGVEYRIVDEKGRSLRPGLRGLLEVRTEPGAAWHRTDDLATADEDGRVTILGRRHAAIRRGGRWVAPLEVESVLRGHPLVRDVHVRSRPGRFADEESLIADVACAAGDVDPAALLAFAKERLAPYKVPDEVRLHRHLPRNAAGKLVAGPRYRLADPARLLAAARAYRISELLFALHDLGALGPLRDGTDADELAERLGLPPSQVGWLLGVAAELGLVRTGVDPADPADPADLEPFLRLEEELSRGWLTRDALVGAVRVDPRERPFERADLGDLPEIYQAAMHGQWARRRTSVGLGLLGRRPVGRVLEVSAGPGRYLAEVLRRHPGACGHLVPLGRLAGPVDGSVAAAAAQGRVVIGGDPPRREFDVCVVANGIHGPAPGDDLGWLLDRLREDGVLLVDDIFLPESGETGAEIGLDWLTHGGISWPRIDDLKSGISASGGSVIRSTRFAGSECHLVLVSEGR